MKVPSIPHSLARRAAPVALAILAGATLVATGASAAPSTSLASAKLTGFAGVLVNQSSRTLYVLSVEKGDVIKCKGACLSTWTPLLVKKSVTTIVLGANVDGKIGFVKRSSTTKQVTFNTFPLYTYTGDSGPRQTNGEGVSAYGGRWFVVKASSTRAATTAIEKSSPSGPKGTTTTSTSTTTTTTEATTTSTTTTTLSGGGGGY